MRKAQKQEILEMIQTLHQAHDEVKKYIETNNIQPALDMLGQCQECAISIGTAIENFEGEGFITVSYIEEYCDVLYKSHEALNTDASPNSIKIYKNLKKQLLKIENSIKNDIRVRKEVAFFPYKASMWDSLESIYLAAKEDPDCDAYCVPIPYYDRNPDRSLGQMHYEGREYPKNIEVIDWQTYNFEERKPDVIYIHNPYDDWNLVTCVHPRYFSSNLKKYTDKLVYVPYFVLDEIEPDDQARIDGMKHFIWTPGVINADRVIVQSEKMKQIYVNEYLKAAQVNGLQGKHLDRKYLEEKFLGLGSPKFDKVLNTKKEDLEIPEEWLKIIEKPDGSWKKIIFYNTSIAALLENNEKMLEKMKDVFRIFKENKDEVALLWRPHPLIKTTVSAMRPQLWVEYEKLVKQYKEEGWGIYDDSSDMDRAVVLSDAYYGDQSSVVQVYQKTGKKILIEDANMISVPKNKLLFNCLYLEKGGGYFISTYTKKQALLFINFSDGEIEIVQENISDCNRKYGYSVINGTSDKIFIFPYIGNNSYIRINLPEGNVEKIEKLKDTNDTFPVCTNSFKYKDSIYFIINNSNCIVEYNVLSKQFTEHYLQCRKTELWKFYWNSFAQIDNYIYLPLKECGEIIKIDLDSMSVDTECIIKNEKIQKVIYHNDNLWFLSFNSAKIIQYNLSKKNIREIYLSENESKYMFEGIYQIKNDLILFPHYSKNFYVINSEEGTAKIISAKRLGLSTIDNSVFSVVASDKKYVCVISSTDNNLVRINRITGDVEKYDISLPANEMKKLNDIEESVDIFSEKDGYGIMNLINEV